MTATLSAGDVKYHKGFSSGHRRRPAGRCTSRLRSTRPTWRLSIPSSWVLCVRASIVVAMCRASRCMPASCMHGDAALAGQGVVQETLNARRKRAHYRYRWLDAHRGQQSDWIHHERSARCALHALLHRHCEDGRSADLPRQHAMILKRRCLACHGDRASSYRTIFHKDVFVDIVCFRKRQGHNEAGRADGDAAVDVQKNSSSIPGTRASSMPTTAGRSRSVVIKRRPKATPCIVTAFRDGDGQGLHTPTRPSCRTLLPPYQQSTGRSFVGNRSWTDHRQHHAAVEDSLKELAKKLVTTMPEGFVLHIRASRKVIADRQARWAKANFRLTGAWPKILRTQRWSNEGVGIRLSGRRLRRAAPSRIAIRRVP